MLSDADKKEIQKRLEALTGAVTVKLFTQVVAGTCQYCADTETLMKETVALSDKLTLEIVSFINDEDVVKSYGIGQIPALVIEGESDHGIRLYGIPAGYEFAVVLDTLIMVSNRDSALPEKIKTAAKAIDQPVHIQVFSTPTCPYCPRAAMAAIQLAMVNPQIRVDIVEITEYPHLAQKYGVMGVPKVVINESRSFEGALPIETFLEQIQEAVA